MDPFSSFSQNLFKVAKRHAIKAISRFSKSEALLGMLELTRFRVLSVRLSLEFWEVYSGNLIVLELVSSRKWKPKGSLERPTGGLKVSHFFICATVRSWIRSFDVRQQCCRPVGGHLLQRSIEANRGQ